MEKVISKLQSTKFWKEDLRKTCRRNKLSIDIVNYFTPLRFRSALLHFVQVHQRKTEKANERWLQNELKAFYWFCVCLCSIEDTKISEFGEEHWRTLHQIFWFKNLMTLKYEAKKLICEVGPQKTWSNQEEAIFSDIMRSQNDQSNRWNEKARQLYEQSNGLFLRSGKQCRQKWLNHLDPTRNHGEWEPVQERQFIQLILQKGRKWSKIARQLKSNRTEHMVKNRYKTLIGKQKRLYPDIKDEDELLTLFLSKFPSIIMCNDSKESSQSQKEKMTMKEEILEEIIQQESNQKMNKQNQISEPKQEIEEKKDKPITNSIRGNSSLDLAQVYSPWIMNVPATPAFSPNVGYFLNLPNFSSFQNLLQGNFYSPGRF